MSGKKAVNNTAIASFFVTVPQQLFRIQDARWSSFLHSTSERLYKSISAQKQE